MIAGLVLALVVLGGDGELEELRGVLREAPRRERAAAVRALARLGGREPWELVVGALADPDGEVAEAAQWCLGERGDEEVLRLLDGRGGLRARSPVLRRRAAEVLGRLAEPVPTALFGRSLRDADADVRRLAAWSVERQARAGRLDEPAELTSSLVKLARVGRDGALRGRALFALAAAAPAEARAVVRGALNDRDDAVRCAATALLSEVLDEGYAVGLLVAHLGDASIAVRLAAIDGLSACRGRAAPLALVRQLGAEREPRLAWLLVQRLRALSGLAHKGDPRPWLDWAEALPADWRPPSLPDRTPSDAAPSSSWSERSVAFAGLPILSPRVCFLIDLSGSIHRARADGRTRKQVVDERLAAVLAALPATTRFNLIPYTREPLPWRAELAFATPRNVRAAAAWFAACDRSGSGNLWDALELAAADPDVDTLVVLTDGAPTGGPYNRLELLAPLFLERNATRRLALDAILIDAPRGLVRRWETLTRATGGRLVEVSLK